MGENNKRDRTEKYQRLKEQAVIAVLTAPTISDAAQSLNVSESTLYRWLAYDDFLEALRAARQEATKQAFAKLQRGTSRMVDVLFSIAEDKMASPAARVSAARSVLETVIKVTEDEEIITRLKRLEELIDD